MPESQPPMPHNSTPPSRRAVLQRAGVVGAATIWTAPFVQSIAMPFAAAASPPPGVGTITGQVTDASTGDPLEGALVNVSDTGQNALTDASGNYVINNVPSGDQTLTAMRSGYLTSTQTTTVPEGGTVVVNFGLAPAASGAIRAVLNWGATPRDLDLHVSGPNSEGAPGRFHVYFANKQATDSGGNAYAELDVDDRNGNGPETDTIRISPAEGDYVAGRYHLWVHNWENDAPFDASDATLTLFGLTGQIASYHQSDATGLDTQRIWLVVQFDVSDAGVISNVTPQQAMADGTASSVF